MNENGEDAIALETSITIDGEWGYACIEHGAVFIPAVMATADWPLRRVLAHLYQQSKLTRFIFTAVIDPDGLKSHLRHVIREWDEYVEYMDDYSHCIEIEYEVHGR